MKGAILTLKNKDKKELLKEGNSEIKCQYCSEIKTFNKKELEKIFNKTK